VDVRQVLRDHADRFVGINLNYIRDEDANRPDAPQLASALRDLGVRWLRYPAARSRISACGRVRLPAGRIRSRSVPMRIFPESGWISIASFRPPARPAPSRMSWSDMIRLKRTGRTEDDWLRDVVALVRYANVTKKYGVTYWEIGNENWSNRTTTATEMARVVRKVFTRNEGGRCQSIRIGSNGSGESWWAEFLPAASRDLDFISLKSLQCRRLVGLRALAQES